MLQDSDFGAQTPSRSSLGLHPDRPLNSASASLTHTFTPWSWVWRQRPAGLTPAPPFFHLQPCSAPFSRPPTLHYHSSRMPHANLLKTKPRSGVKVPLSPSDLTLDIPNLDSLALDAHPRSLLPPSTQHLSSATPDHLQRWSGESGSRGNISCKASHCVQRSVGGASSCRLGHPYREGDLCPTHFLEPLSLAT